PLEQLVELSRRFDAAGFVLEVMSAEDRRFAWGSYGDTDFARVAPHYIEGADRLARLQAIKRRVDPDDRFRANRFGLDGRV
ncbi:MAG TPA: hypothetical protein PK095_18415, partial [Myxococcota bacterium]|nr:hypothetical protein [Myxococcota bacterium]